MLKPFKNFLSADRVLVPAIGQNIKMCFIIFKTLVQLTIGWTDDPSVLTF
jgi:hypothetical protein